MKNTKDIKKNKGITLISLVITIVVMLIVTSITVYTSVERSEKNKLNKMINDLKFLSDKVSNYYLKYNGLPIVRDSENNLIKYTYTQLEFEQNEDDYYILDLDAMEGILLNYGEIGYSNPNTSEDVYVINKNSHKIYYVKGITVDGIKYNSIQDELKNEYDIIPPTMPQINIINGEISKVSEDGIYYYTGDLRLELASGKGNSSEKIITEYSVDNGVTWENIPQSNIYVSSENDFKISIKSYDNKNNESANVTKEFKRYVINEDTVEKVFSETENVKIDDEYGNTVVIPAGFSISSETTNVPSGVVIKDEINEFVWVPVGNVKKGNEEVQIELARYKFDVIYDESLGNLTGTGEIKDKYFSVDDKISDGDYYYKEGRIQNIAVHDSGVDLKGYAQNIVTFKNSVKENGGFYIGRYEARTDSTTPREGSGSYTTMTCNNINAVYNYIGQNNASKACKGMYKEKPFTSDLINSFAWDTAIRFIQSCEYSNYSIKQSVNTLFSYTGTTEDKVCNIFDMASNCFEWVTETYSNNETPCVYRGGNYENTQSYTSYKKCTEVNTSDKNITFRPIIYI